MTRTLSTVSVPDGKWHRDDQAICYPPSDPEDHPDDPSGFERKEVKPNPDLAL